MQKITIQALPEPSVIKNVRSNLAEQFEAYWLRSNASMYGMQYFKFEDGKVRWENSLWERKDLLLVRHSGCCNTFIEPSGTISIQPFDGIVLDKEEREEIKAFCKTLIAEGSQYFDYFEREKRWLRWLQEQGPSMDGMTVEEAIKALNAFE